MTDLNDYTNFVFWAYFLNFAILFLYFVRLYLNYYKLTKKLKNVYKK